MPATTATNSLIPVQPVAKHPPRSIQEVLAGHEAKWIFTEDEVAHSPSIVDGYTQEKEWELRSKGLGFIMQVGIILKLPQLTLSTAGIFFNRFLMRYSLVGKPPEIKPLHHYQVAAVALFLATKTEENHRNMKEIIVACCRVAQKNPNLLVDEQSRDYWRWRDTILLNEDTMLELLCFDLTVESPHKILFDLLKQLGVEHNKRLRNAAWAFVNDSCLTCMCLLFHARIIAAAAVYCAIKHVTGTLGEQVQLVPEFDEENGGQPWWTALQDVEMRLVKRAVNFMANIHQPAGQDASTEQQKPGATPGDASIYKSLHTPVSDADQDSRSRNGGFGDEGNFDRLRLSSNAPQTPADEHSTGRGDRSERGIKRDRDGTPRPAWSQNTDQVESASNTQITQSQPTMSQDEADESQKRAKTANGTKLEEADEASEEGEVEE